MKYNEEHEWVNIQDDIAIVGISDYAVKQLGDITFVELPEIGSSFNKEDSAAFVESVKAASDIYMPLSGEIIEVNAELNNAPQKLNENAIGEFIFKIKLSNMNEVNELMDENAYSEYLKTL